MSDAEQGKSIGAADLRAAAAQIAGRVIRTPLVHSRTLSEITGAEVWLKLENQQFVASFKERGAANKLLTLSAEEARRGVIAMSAGNHAQGVAYHAHRLGIAATIVMPKIDAVREGVANQASRGAGSARGRRYWRSPPPLPGNWLRTKILSLSIPITIRP